VDVLAKGEMCFVVTNASAVPAANPAGTRYELHIDFFEAQYINNYLIEVDKSI